MKNNIIETLMKTPMLRNLGLKEDTVVEILRAYNDIAFNEMLTNGYISLGNGLTIDVVQLLDRVHKLRGVSYKNTRKYKLKVTLDDKAYKKIEDYYNKLKEDIL